MDLDSTRAADFLPCKAKRRVPPVFVGPGVEVGGAPLSFERRSARAAIPADMALFDSGAALSSGPESIGRPAASVVLLAALVFSLFVALAPGRAAAQDHTRIQNWDGSVETSVNSLTIAPGEFAYYNVRLKPPPTWDEVNDGPFIPDGEEWFVILHIGGVRSKGHGLFKDLVVVPGRYRTFDNSDWNTWKSFQVRRLSDEDWEAGGGGPRATSVIFDHEVVDHENNCPVHDSGPLTVYIGDSDSQRVTGNENDGNRNGGNQRKENTGNSGNGNNGGQSVTKGLQQGRAWANRAVLPEMGRALAFSAARCRIERMFSDIAGGWSRPSTASLLPPAFAARGPERARALDLKQAFGNASYLLPLGGEDARFAAWACSGYRSLEGSDKGGMALWGGDLLDMQFGTETRLRPDMLAGVALSRAESDIDYSIAGENALSGNYDLRMTGAHPYFGLKPSSGLEIWGTAGFGQGTLRVRNSAGVRYSGKARLTSAAFGINSRVLERESARLTVKSELGLANLDVSSASRTFAKAAADLQRFRLAAELDREETIPHGGILAPWGELGLRQDSGDGKAGASLELGGGLRYLNIEQGWNSEVFGRWLAARASGRPKEHGFGLRFRYDPGAPGFGPRASLAHSRGPAGRGAQRLWEDRRDNGSEDDFAARRLELELAYGLRAFRSRSALTPYARLGLNREGNRTYRLGARFAPGNAMTLSLEAVRLERAGRDAVHVAVLEAVARF